MSTVIFFKSLSPNSMPPVNVLKPPSCLPGNGLVLVPTNSILVLSGLMGRAPAAILTWAGSLGSPEVPFTLGGAGTRAVEGGVFGLGAGVLSAAGQPSAAIKGTNNSGFQ